MTDFLFYGGTERSAAMRHELPVGIGDPFLLGIVGGQLHVMTSSLERSRVVTAAPHAVLHDLADLGLYDLLESGMSSHELELELASRAAKAMGVTVAVADRLRADGLALQPDHEAVTARRRVKSAAEIQGIRRAQQAAEAGMTAAAAVLRMAVPDGDRLTLEGEVLTAEAVRAVLRDACQRHGAPAPPDVIVASVHQGYGHEAGSGPLPANLPIAIDLWPRDETSGCWADMTRTFVVGEVSEAVRNLELLVRAGLERARQAVRPGVSGRELHALVCEVFESAGHRTQRTGPGKDPNEGFQFSLGHGIASRSMRIPPSVRRGMASWSPAT